MLRGKERLMPGPTYMSEEQKAEYLDSLRKGALSRPSGSRPPPPSKPSILRRVETEANLAVQTHDDRPGLTKSNTLPIMPVQEPGLWKRHSRSSLKGSLTGRPLVRAPSATLKEEGQEMSAEKHPMKRTPSMPYMERGTRWMEKQEVRSLRMALEDMDAVEERRIYSAAQDEAAELVWKHQTPNAAYVNPDGPHPNPDVARDYHSHLRKGSYQRSHTQDTPRAISQRSSSGGSQDASSSAPLTSNKRKSTEVLQKISPPAGTVTVEKRRTPSDKSYGGLAEAVAEDISKAHRRTSSGSKRILSGEKKMLMHPDDRIWEDPQEENAAQMHNVKQARPTASAQQPAYIRKNPFARVRMQAEKPERSQSEPIMHNSVEIQRNAPSQSRRPWYMSNEALPPSPSSLEGISPDEVSPKVTPTKDGKEVRSDDIRAATSKPRKDYSPKLPRPTFVSDKPGRPIVSFEKNWKPQEVVLEEGHSAHLPKFEPEPSKRNGISSSPGSSSTGQASPQFVNVPQICVNETPGPPVPEIFVNEPSIPSVCFPEDSDSTGFPSTRYDSVAPAINVQPPTISIQPPAISVNGPEEPSGRSRPSSQRPTPALTRPLPHHAATSPILRSTPHYSPSVRQSGTLCAHCALPIAGRILSAAGQRFHPSCFICHHCGTDLELVAFYPEPEEHRAERLDRIAARRAGVDLPNSEGKTAEDLWLEEANDGDETLRFYCHLDFHELFSPRCKSCKTPIEGEIIVACGAEWHVGHFFCAQCGDPFDSSTPFVEKDGYAWCVGCHTNRYSSKCRKCKKPITETVVKALGYDWHGDCFICTECNGEFEDGRYFLSGSSQAPVCVKCEERRLKA